MKYTEIKWEFVNPLEDESTIQEFEESVGYKLPEIFKEIVKKYNGGAPFDPETDKTLCFDSEFGGGADEIAYLCDFNKSADSNVWDEQFVQEDRDEFLEFSGTDAYDFVFFSYTPGGDEIGFKRDTDEIILFAHETGEVEILAPDFKTFLESMFVYNEEDDQ